MSYSFLKESKLYIVYGGNKYRIYTSTAISFNQTFAEDSYSVKTLHDQSKMLDNVTITKANPASFSFDVPLTIEKNESIVLNLATDLVAKTGNPESSVSTRHDATETGISIQQLKRFDMYVQTGSNTFKVENCVVTSANFDFQAESQFTLRLEGQGTKVSRVGNQSYTIPGSAISESTTRTPLLVYPVVTIDSLDMSSIISVTLQLQNDISFTNYENLHDSLSVTSSSNAQFPNDYTVNKRILSGEIRQYTTNNNNTQFDDFSTNSNLTIKAVQVGKAANATPFFQIALNPVKYTARLSPEEVYTQSYDYMSLDNTAVGTSITQYS